MNTQLHLDMLAKATKKVEDIESCEKQIKILNEGIKGFSGANFPKLKAEQLARFTVLNKELRELKVDYKMIMNSLR